MSQFSGENNDLSDQVRQLSSQCQHLRAQNDHLRTNTSPSTAPTTSSRSAKHPDPDSYCAFSPDDFRRNGDLLKRRPNEVTLPINGQQSTKKKVLVNFICKGYCLLQGDNEAAYTFDDKKKLPCMVLLVFGKSEGEQLIGT